MADTATPKATHNVSGPKRPQLSPAQAKPWEGPHSAAGPTANAKETHNTSGAKKSVVPADQRGPGQGPFTALAPSVQRLVPDEGGTAGGTVVRAIGYNMRGVTAVSVGGAAATAVTVVNDRELQFTTPARTAGAKDVVITKADGPDTTETAAFTYA